MVVYTYLCVCSKPQVLEIRSELRVELAGELL